MVKDPPVLPGAPTAPYQNEDQEATVMVPKDRWRMETT